MNQIITSHLKEDSRLNFHPIATKRIFSHESYEVFLILYPPSTSDSHLKTELVTFEVHFKTEELTILAKLWNNEKTGVEPEDVFKSVIDTLQGQNRGPYELIRDAKEWANVPYTERDEGFLIAEGIEIPRNESR